MNRFFKKSLILFLSVLLCISMASCLFLQSAIEQIYNNALDTNNIDDREYAYGDENKLGVTFENGEMFVEWDTVSNIDYSLIVKTDTETFTYNDSNEDFVPGKTSLTDLGYTFSQNLNISLDATQKTLMGTRSTRVGYDYSAMNAETYDRYTSPVNAGFRDIDYYMGNRTEWFDFWSYLIIFRENAELKDGCYEMTCSVYMGYDYLSLYSTSNYEDAFANEVYSAIDAFEDSAAYNYSFEIDKNGRIGTIYLKFLYDFNPKYNSDTGSLYKNATDKTDAPHYSESNIPKTRSFAIDKNNKTISVESSDQLYFTLKKGYRPLPKENSNAEYLYNEMKRILSLIIDDNDTEVEKVHYIYDYIVDTVLYDYLFTDEIYTDDDISISELFSYKCLYMEGVFGLENSGTFSKQNRIAICDGLSKAFLSLSVIEGLECLKISGTVNEEGHAWNKVKIDDMWYMVDTTWGNQLDSASSKEYLCHEYLLVPDDNNHVETPYITYPDAKYRYNFGGKIDNDPTDNGQSYNPWLPSWIMDPKYSA